jgi:WD40 repeat protein
LIAAATVEDLRRDQVRVWDAQHRSPVSGFRIDTSAVTFSPHGRLIAAAGGHAPTQVRDARTGRLVARLKTLDDGRSVAFSPDGTLLATGLYNGMIQIWSTKGWKLAGPALEGHSKPSRRSSSRATAARF